MMQFAPPVVLVFGMSCIYQVEIEWSWDWRGGAVSPRWRLKQRVHAEAEY